VIPIWTECGFRTSSNLSEFFFISELVQTFSNRTINFSNFTMLHTGYACAHDRPHLQWDCELNAVIWCISSPLLPDHSLCVMRVRRAVTADWCN